ncbi:PIG-L family deacetylase [Sphingobacterium sp. HJSM2_6]|uniref:PIG-L family deacetylase n=1 Tax=Sphingobacterium sp. HJSM2_6 TaxID=3366264 RepID=UPI003BD17649
MYKIIAFIYLLFPYFSIAQSNNSASIKLAIDKLNTLGTVLYFAAHPDDENTRLIAWLANEKHYKTGYLSLTRGDGGQNLIGTEIGIELGLIRTQELLAARNIDQGEQYFTSAYDFGFSKTHEETFNFWKKEETLKEAVYLIRKLQPDVIITRFPPDTRGGHGHHQASAMLAHEAFDAAADPNKFPEQLKLLKPWKAKRLVWNTANFGGMNNTNDNQLKIEIGDYNPLLGYSYGEIAAKSRSQHKSQGFGAASNRGKSTEYFEHVTGTKATESLFDGINSSWDRLNEPQLTNKIKQQIEAIQETFRVQHPEQSIAQLNELHASINSLKPSLWKDRKLRAVETIILQCAGILLESVTAKPNFQVQESINVSNEIIVRNPEIKVILLAINDKAINETIPFNETSKFNSSLEARAWTQPYWLEKPNSLGKFDVQEQDFGNPENVNTPSVEFKISVQGLPITVNKEIQYRYVDPVDGEILQPISITPIFTAELENNNVLLAANGKKELTLKIKNHSSIAQKATLTIMDNADVKVRLDNPNLEIPAFGELNQTLTIEKLNDKDLSNIQLLINNQKLTGIREIAYPHIPKITWFPPLAIQVKNIELNHAIKRVAYISGAGDLIPQSLENIGIQVDQLKESQLSVNNLIPYDAVVVGVRAYNVSKNLKSWMPQLLAYTKQGGTVLVQYNVNTRIPSELLGPYPFELTRSRVTEEDAKVVFNLPNDPSMQYPNKITAKDFDNWVQERGLYFADNADSNYRKPLSFADKNEQAHDGSLLIASYGQGKFVYTSLSFFRQLPAAVPGAYRLFVNLLSKEVK